MFRSHFRIRQTTCQVMSLLRSLSMARFNGTLWRLRVSRITGIILLLLAIRQLLVAIQRPKWTQSWPRVGPKSAQGRPKAGPESAQSRPEVGPKSPQVGPKLAQSLPKSDPKLAQSRSKVAPNSRTKRQHFDIRPSGKNSRGFHLEKLVW